MTPRPRRIGSLFCSDIFTVHARFRELYVILSKNFEFVLHRLFETCQRLGRRFGMSTWKMAPNFSWLKLKQSALHSNKSVYTS